jgi:hypothetical protein
MSRLLELPGRPGHRRLELVDLVDHVADHGPDDDPRDRQGAEHHEEQCGAPTQPPVERRHRRVQQPGQQHGGHDPAEHPA